MKVESYPRKSYQARIELELDNSREILSKWYPNLFIGPIFPP